MTNLAILRRHSRFPLDVATWHAHLAGHEAPSRLVSLQRPAQVRPAPQAIKRLLRPDLATWHAHLVGTRQVAA